MQITPAIICLIIALVFFLLATFGARLRDPNPISFRDAGFAMVTLAFILS